MMTLMSSFIMSVLLDGKSFTDYLSISFLEEALSIHVVIYTLLIVIIILLFSVKSYRPNPPIVLTAKEVQECIDQWKPEPLYPSLNDQQRLDIETIPILQSEAGAMSKVAIASNADSNTSSTSSSNSMDVINLASHNFLSFSLNPEVKKAAKEAIRKYGPGSCGPRGFYGTLDVHTEFEDEIAKFLGTEAAILYSCGFATIASAIPAFSKRGDDIVCDSGVRHAIQIGAALSRSKTHFFKHNDMEDLEATLKKITSQKVSKLNRRFIIVEGVYLNYGDICHLDKVVELAKRHRFRVILDDSYALGSLGPSGKGSTEHFSIPVTDITILLADTSVCFGCIGGICAGKFKIVNHNRLNGSGYCFSASNPPYLAAAGTASVRQLTANSNLPAKLRENSVFMYDKLSNLTGLRLCGTPNSPLLHLKLSSSVVQEDRIENETFLQKIVDECLKRGVLLTRAKYAHSQQYLPEPSIRIALSATHTREQLEEAANVIAEVSAAITSSIFG